MQQNLRGQVLRKPGGPGLPERRAVHLSVLRSRRREGHRACPGLAASVPTSPLPGIQQSCRLLPDTEGRFEGIGDFRVHVGVDALCIEGPAEYLQIVLQLDRLLLGRHPRRDRAG